MFKSKRRHDIFIQREFVCANVQAHSDIILSNVRVIVLIVRSGVSDLVTDWHVCVYIRAGLVP